MKLSVSEQTGNDAAIKIARCQHPAVGRGLRFCVPGAAFCIF